MRNLFFVLTLCSLIVAFYSSVIGVFGVLLAGPDEWPTVIICLKVAFVSVPYAISMFWAANRL